MKGLQLSGQFCVWVPQAGMGKGSISDTCFPFQPQRPRGRRCLCVLSATRCSSSDQNRSSQLLGPALPDTQDSGCSALAQREPGLLGFQCGITLPEDTCACCSSCHCQAGGRPALLATQGQLGPCASALPLSSAAAPSLGWSLGLTGPCHVLAQALWPGSVMKEPSFQLMVLFPPPGWGRTPSGLCPYLFQHCAR